MIKKELLVELEHMITAMKRTIEYNDNGFNVEAALPIIEEAKKAIESSYTPKQEGNSMLYQR